MKSPPIALVAGATGAVGRRLLELLLAREDGTRVIAVARRPPDTSNARLEWLASDLAGMPATLRGHECTEAFCCLGTTMKRAGSRAGFRAVDLDGVTTFARAARSSGARFFGMVSAAGADPTARNFYLRTKGEAESAVEALDFPSLTILQPGLLRGSRDEFRAGEMLGQVAAPLLDRLLLGGLARYRSVAINTVAMALNAAAHEPAAGVRRLGPADMEALAHVR